MKKFKYSIIFLLILMIIGYATISVSLKLDGNANILGDLDDFKVYISNVVVDGKQDLRFVKNDKELFFSMDFLDIGSQHVIKYDVTNASSVFDASLSINCTQGDEYLSVSNEFDVSTNLTSKSTRTGTLTLKKLKSNSNENHFTINVTCTIVASPIEKDSVDDNNVVSPVQPIELQTGDIIDIDGEYFNVISHTEEIVTILSQYNLGTNYRQSNQANYLSFSNTNGWEYTPGPKEIDIQQYDGNAKTYVNEYVSYLKKATRSNNVSGNLITMKELKSLGCTINDDYSYTSNITCTNSEYKPWLFNGQVLWTSSARNDDGSVWVLENDDMFSSAGHSNVLGCIRPVITIPIDVAKKHYVKTYKIGEEVSIGNEKFNIISDNVNKVTMLAQLGLGTDYRQTTNNNTLKFSTSNGWEYKPGPKEIDIQQYDGNAKTYVNEYVSYLKDETGDSTLTGNLITLTELKSLGCTINDDYSTSDTLTCENSQYKTWIINNQNWWTRSANTSNSSYIWMIKEDGKLTYGTYHNFLIIRPIITINKKYIS